MARDGSGIMSFPGGTAAVSAATIGSAAYNVFLADLLADLNTPRPVVMGGTGAATAAAARTALGLALGTNVQAWDAGLDAYAALVTAANKGIYFTGSDVPATFDLTAAGRAILDDANAAAQLVTLGAAAAATTLTAAGLATGGGDLSANRTITVPAATQANMEAASSAAVAVTPAVMQNHPGVAKCWAYVTVAAGTPNLAVNYNITSITDVGAGDLTITIATDFSTANWAALATVKAASNQIFATVVASAAGSVELACFTDGGAQQDPTAWSFAGFGDQ